MCVLVNCLTNPVVVTLHSFFPAPAVTAALELGAVVTEALLYRAWGRNVYRPWLFALLVNAFSYFLGVLINHLFLS